MAALIALLKDLMNGAKLPNWAKVFVILSIVLLIWIGQLVTTGQLADAQKGVAKRQTNEMRMIRQDIETMQEELEADIHMFAQRDSMRVRRLEKKLDLTNRRIDEMNENGTDGTNERLDELIRTLRKRR